jgi:hypothetical protein
METNGQFFFQNNVFKLQEDFSELGIRVFLEEDLEVSRHFLFYIYMRQTIAATKILKTVLKTRLKTKDATYTLVFVKYFVVSCRSNSIRAFSVFLEDSLRIISGT